jgi:hypothetical protein
MLAAWAHLDARHCVLEYAWQQHEVVVLHPHHVSWLVAVQYHLAKAVVGLKQQQQQQQQQQLV